MERYSTCHQCVCSGSYSHLRCIPRHCTPEGQDGDFIQIQYFGEFVYYPTAFFTKTSILCLIARNFRTASQSSPSRTAHYMSYVFLLPTCFLYQGFQMQPDPQDLGCHRSGQMYHHGVEHFSRRLRHQHYQRSNYFHGCFRWRHYVGPPSLSHCLAFCVTVCRAKPFPKALAAIITRTILNSTLDSEDVTYSVQIVMLLG